MPGSLAQAVVASGAVLPQTLCTAYTESQSYSVLTNQYKDGTLQISLVQDGATYYTYVNAPRALRVWKLTKKLSAISLPPLFGPSQLAVLQAFYYAMQQGTGSPAGTTLAAGQPFYFYDPF